MSACCSFVPETPNARQLCFAFSDDGRFFAVGTKDGFVVYCTEPFVPLTVRTDIPGCTPGGVSLLSMYGRSNLLLLVSPARPKTVLLWNEACSPPAVAAEANFHSDVVAVRLHQALMLVADANGGVHLFSRQMQCVQSFQYNAASRAPGLPSLAIGGPAVCSVSSSQQKAMMMMRGGSDASFRSDASFSSDASGGGGAHGGAGGSSALASTASSSSQFPIAFACPSTVGNIVFLHVDIRGSPPLRVTHRRSVAVHNKAVGVVVFCANGKFAASCSTGGSSLKLTHVQSGSVLMQFNRGATQNRICSIAFCGLSYLSCVSSTGSVHLFAIVDRVQQALGELGRGVGADAAAAAAAAAADSPPHHNGDSNSNSNRNLARPGGLFGVFQTWMQTTVDFHDAVWSCGHFDMLHMHPGASKRALFGPAIVGFLDGVEDDGSLRFVVAHGESGKVGKVRFVPNASTAAASAAAAAGGGVVQSQAAAAVQAPMGACTLMHAWSFPTDSF